MAGRHLPPHPDEGDANTIGGYRAVHDRPAAFEGSDGYSYSVELCVDATGDAARPVGAFCFFPRWRRVGEQGVAGHLESAFVAWGRSEDEALTALGAWPLSDVRAELERLIAAQRAVTDDAPEAGRRWMSMRPADDSA